MSIITEPGRLTEDELWSALANWQLFAHCPRCGGELHIVVYRMTVGPLPHGYIAAGCTALDDAPSRQCARCEFDLPTS